MILPEVPDVTDYAERFHSEKKSRFEDRYDEILEDIGPDQIRPSIQSKISLEQEHVDLIRAVSSGFHQDKNALGSSSGFKFTFVNPLVEQYHGHQTNGYELDIGADVLLARTREFSRVQLCVVACEVDDSNVPQWIENINEIHETFNDPDNQDQILSQIGAGSRTLDQIQYITLVKPEDYDELQFGEINTRCNPSEFAIWTAEMNGSSQICYEDGEIIHKELLDVIEDCFDYDVRENPIEYSVDTDPVIPLQNVIFRLVRGKDIYEDSDEPLEFTRSEFKQKYSEKLNLGVPKSEYDKMIDSLTTTLLNLGERIGIFSQDDTKLDVSDYRIMYRGSDDAKTAEDAVREKYVDEAAENQSKVEAFTRVKEEFDSGQSGLGDFQ